MSTGKGNQNFDVLDFFGYCGVVLKWPLETVFLVLILFGWTRLRLRQHKDFCRSFQQQHMDCWNNNANIVLQIQVGLMEIGLFNLQTTKYFIL